MKIFCGLTGALALFAVTVAASTAASSSHDTCTVTGNGTSYTLDITIPKGAPQQRAFALTSPGTSILNLDVEGLPGNPATSGLPRGTNAEWVVTGQALPGTFTANVQTSGEPKGSFTVRAVGKTKKIVYAPVTCHKTGGGGVSNAFSASSSPSYSASAHAWTETVNVPGPGTVSYVEVFTKNGGPLISKGAPPKQLVEGGEVAVTKAGPVALTLKPTPAGLAAVKKGSASIYLSVSFKPTNAIPQTKVLTLALRR